MSIAVLIAIAAAASDPAGCGGPIDHRGFVRSQLLACATADMDHADAMLNATYVHVLARVGSSARARLRRKERAWIVRRRDRCHAAANAQIPSPEINRMRCLVRETVSRTATLRAMR